MAEHPDVDTMLTEEGPAAVQAELDELRRRLTAENSRLVQGDHRAEAAERRLAEQEDDLQRLRTAVYERDVELLNIRAEAAQRAEELAKAQAMEHRLRARLAETTEVMQGDLAAVLRALGVGDHARPYSPHEVVQRDILPAIQRLREGTDRD